MKLSVFGGVTMLLCANSVNMSTWCFYTQTGRENSRSASLVVGILHNRMPMVVDDIMSTQADNTRPVRVIMLLCVMLYG